MNSTDSLSTSPSLSKPNIEDWSFIWAIGSLLEKVKVLASTLDQDHSYRYVKLVTTSTAKHGCKYARASHMQWIISNQKEETIAKLVALRDQINMVLAAASGEPATAIVDGEPAIEDNKKD